MKKSIKSILSDIWAYIFAAIFCSIFLFFCYLILYLLPYMIIDWIDPAEGSAEWKRRNGLCQTYDVDYDIQSLRVDDDGEFHVIAISKSGSIENLHDVKYMIDFKYGNYEKPIYKVHYTDSGTGSGRYTRDGNPTICLPFDYKIEGFDD
jgi:hypothetical protein